MLEIEKDSVPFRKFDECQEAIYRTVRHSAAVMYKKIQAFFHSKFICMSKTSFNGGQLTLSIITVDFSLNFILSTTNTRCLCKSRNSLFKSTFLSVTQDLELALEEHYHGRPDYKLRLI